MTKSLNRINFLTKALLKNTTADNDPFKFRALKIAIMNILIVIVMIFIVIILVNIIK